MYSVYFSNSQNGIAVGNSGKIIKTTNGGTNWIEQNSNTTGVLYSLSFVPKGTLSYGFATGWNGKILKSTDGGANWYSQPSGTTKTLYGVHFVNQNTGYAVGENGVILKTTNGGGVGIEETISNENFQNIYPNPFNDLLTVEITDLFGSEISVYSVDGQLLLRQKAQSELLTLDLRQLAKGVYFLKVKTSNGESYSKIVKN